MLVPILSAPKEPPNTSVSQEPCAVKCCPYFASWNQNKIGGAYNYSGATFEPVWVYFGSLCIYFTWYRKVHKKTAQRTRERHERARKSPGAWKRDARVMSMFTFDMTGCSFCLTILEWKETARSLDTGPESYVGKIQSLSYYFMAEGAHRRKNGICKRGINLLPEKDNISSSGRNLSGW